MENKSETKRCENCRGEIAFGSEFITTEKSVIGPRGFVPLGDIRLFCTEKCVSEFFGQFPGDDPGFPERQPY